MAKNLFYNSCCQLCLHHWCLIRGIWFDDQRIITAFARIRLLIFKDNACKPLWHTPYQTVYEFTLVECVRYLFDAGCPLVIFMCNTASTALRANHSTA